MMQEDFLEMMKTYPQSFKAMDLVAEHRLRSLHNSQAWQMRQQTSNETHLGSIIEQILQVALSTFLQGSCTALARCWSLQHATMFLA